VLDVGAGLGGSARFLAARYQVHVTGIELVRDFVRLAHTVTHRSGLTDQIEFKHGNALSAPFPTDAFDCAWVQHVLMNIVDKARLVAELRRMLVAGGRLALHEVVARKVRPLRYPLPWARSPLTHFPPAPRRLRIAIASAGFTLRSWEDTTTAALEWWRAVAAGCRDDASRAGWETLLGDDAGEMIGNVVENLESGRMGIVMAVFLKP
jgi:SAM-dependent methyltransferase